MVACAPQANFHTDCRGMQSQLVALSSLMSILDPQLTSFLVPSYGRLQCNRIGFKSTFTSMLP